MKQLLLATLLIPGVAIAASDFERPIPQPQTEMAELWFAIASIALIGAVVAAQLVVNRR
jgi:hypothetical protein